MSFSPAIAWKPVARSLGDSDTLYMDQDAPKHIRLPAAAEKQRVIIVGDVHGCFDELCELLDQVKFQQGVDTLILAGDLVNKGPKSIEVVRFARQVGALAVAGNHELVSLRAHYMRTSGRSHELTGYLS
jgi:predicted MPP superfamily phosphohydrolase